MSIWSHIKRSATERLARNWVWAARPNRAQTPMVSFTFDDFPKSARTCGAPVLKARGVAGSFYVAGSFEGRREEGIDYFHREDLIGLAEEGHEIGCHTFGHIRLPTSTDEEILDDLDRSRDFIGEALGGYQARSFAYPFGDVTVWKKHLVARRFEVSRGIFPGVNQRLIDLRQLKSIPLERRSFEMEAALTALDVAASSNGWVTFFSHDVSDDPSPYGCTPDELGRLVDAALDRGIRVLPVKDAADLVTGRTVATPRTAAATSFRPRLVDSPN